MKERTATCEQCECEHTHTEIAQDSIRYYRLRGRILCEFCYDDESEQLSDCFLDSLE